MRLLNEIIIVEKLLEQILKPSNEHILFVTRFLCPLKVCLSAYFIFITVSNPYTEGLFIFCKGICLFIA